MLSVLCPDVLNNQLGGLPIRSEYISTNDTKMAMQPDTTGIMPESECLCIQPTGKPSTTTGFDDSFSSKTSPRRRKGKSWSFGALWERVVHGKENKALKCISKDNEHEYERLSHIDDKYMSSNEKRMTIESAKPESERVFIQPTPKSSTTEFDDSKLPYPPKTLLPLREGQVSSLGEKVAHGKQDKPLKYPSKDNEHEYEQLIQSDEEYQLSQSDEEYIKMAMESVKPESERLFIQPTENPSTTTGFDDSSSEKLLHRHEDKVWPLWVLWERISDAMKHKPLDPVSKDDEHEEEQLSQQDDEYISSNKENTAMEPDTTGIKPESESLLIQSTQNPLTTGFDDSKLPLAPKALLPHRCEGQGRPLGANMGGEAGEKKGKVVVRFPYKVKEEGKGEQFDRMKDESFEWDDDDEPLSDDEDYPQDGWVGNGDQIADLVLILRWARAYRVSVQIAGRMLNMKPEIVNKALEVKAKSATDPNGKEEALLLGTKPVIKNWWKLGSI